MKLIIHDKIFDRFPDLVVGVLVAKNVDNTRQNEAIQQLLREQENIIRSRYDKGLLSQESKINVWRKAYSSFGVKSKDAKSSVENLYRLVLHGVALKKINNLVDAYNLVSLKYMLPVGGEDIDKIEGDLELAVAGANETPVKLLGDTEPEAPRAGEIFYKDQKGAVCRRWNWREVERTKLTEATKNAIFVIEGLPPFEKNDIEQALTEFKSLIVKYCAGILTTYVLDKNNREISI